MPKRKGDLNTIYISERLQECLRPIARCGLTTVVAPMGYGKTTAVNWYLSQRAQEGPVHIVRVSVYSDNLAIFWKSVQDAFVHAGLSFLADCPCPTDDAGASLLSDDLCRAFAGEVPWYIFIDDFHLLTDGRAAAFLCTLANRLPQSVHLIVASRDRFLPPEETVRLGRQLCLIGTDQLRLNHTELAVYAHRCGAQLSEAQIETLLYSSEGWFSAIYLNLRTLAERGALPDSRSDIYAMFSAAMIDPLAPRQREFLAVMGLADEFTVDMAREITGYEDAEEVLAALTGQNAFVSHLPDGCAYRFHHMMKECAQRAFLTLPQSRQTDYHRRYGRWYETRRQYLHAMAAYRRSGDDHALLRVVRDDAGIFLSSLKPETVLNFLDRCPPETLKAHPLALLVLMRSMFNWRRIPKMLELKELLLSAIAENPDMDPEERGNLLGECDLITSFLMYNDISAMSRLHRSASAQMSRPAVSIRRQGGWTFGSPSVLMMFHRQAGRLDCELAEMDECMPHYYCVTNGHGQGAEHIMRGEAAFLRGQLDDARIALAGAYAQIRDNGQENMALCCDHLAWRLSLCTGETPRQDFDQRRRELLCQHNAAWLNILNSTDAYYHALIGETESIPEVFREHRLASVRYLAPGKPMMELIENQVYLAQGVYAEVIGRSQQLLAVCDAMHYALVAMHVQLQTAGACEMLGRRAEARGLLEQVLQDAAADGLVMPVVENYRYLAPLLADMPQRGDVPHMIELGRRYEARCASVRQRSAVPMAFHVLTPRERDIAMLAAARLSNREIAEKLYLSEGSVKQYVNRIYAKLFIEGDTRTKRKRLVEMTQH